MRTYSILFISPLFAPHGNPEAIVNNKLVLAFMNEGWTVKVVSRAGFGGKAYRYGEEWDPIWMPLKEVTASISIEGPAQSLGKGLRGMARRSGNGILEKLPLDGIRWGHRATEVARDLAKSNRFDIIMTRAGTATSHLPGLRLARDTGLPWLANYNDPTLYMYPGAWRGLKGRILGTMERRINRKVSRECSLLTFPSERLRNYICKQLPEGAIEKSRVIPHVALAKANETVKEKGPRFVITHLGKLGADRTASTFLQALSTLVNGRDLAESIELNLYGIVDAQTMELIDNYNLSGLTRIHGPAPYTEALDAARRSDILVVVESPYGEGIYLPSKFVDYSQSGRPILAASPRVGTLADLVGRCGGGIAADCTSVGAIRNAIEELYEAWRKGELYSRYDTTSMYKLFSPETIMAAYREIFEKIVDGREVALSHGAYRA